jgi:tartrate-resistant acid phosphatase type 5
MQRPFLPFLFILLISSCANRRNSIIQEEVSDEVVKLCLLGDLGHDSPIQKKVADALLQEDCSRIYFLGDLIYPDGITDANDPELEEKFLSYYRPLYKKNPDLQISLMLGNHDYAGDTEAWFKVANENKNIFFPSYYYLEKLSGICMLVLDTNLYVYGEYVLPAIKQMSWLENIENELEECDITVAMAHHPYDGSDYKESWEGARGVMKEFLDRWVIGQVDMYIAGHLHILKDDGEKEGTRLLISGAGGEVQNKKDSPGYVVLTYNPQAPNKLLYSLRKIQMIQK